MPVPRSLRSLLPLGSLCRGWGEGRGRTVSTVVVALSGGLDSSVAALLLRRQGHRVVGVFMSNWDRADEAGSAGGVCPADADYQDVQEVCRRLGITELHRVSFQRQYWTDVFEPFIEGYAGGAQTPNPDVDCNRYIKFDILRKYVNEHIGMCCAMLCSAVLSVLCYAMI
jgi:tRNA U34 2-thiouridine synthase MnmA/TrmU